MLVECDPTRRYPFAAFEPFAKAPATPKPKQAVTSNRSSRSQKAPRRSAEKLDHYLQCCATAAEGDRSEADFALCCFAVRQGIDKETLWTKVEGIGKFAEEGRRYFDLTWDKAAAAAATGAAADGPPEGYDIGGVRLVPLTARTTATKVTVPIEVHVGGRPVDQVRLTDAASGRKNAVQQIARHLENPSPETRAALDKTLGEILVGARRPAPDADDVDDGQTAYELLKAYVPNQVRLIYRTESGRAFSEVLDKEISRQGFIERFTNNVVLSLVEGASDASDGEEGLVNRPALISLVERELKVLWGDLTQDLPAQEDAHVGPTSKAGADFRSAMIRLWTKPTNMALHKQAVKQKSGDETSVQLAFRTSLIARVTEEIKSRDAQGAWCDDKHWKPIQRGFSAWYRRASVDGEIVTYLAMRWELARQIGVELVGVHDQLSLKKLGTKFEVLDPSPKVSACISGEKRIAVLAQDVMEELLFDPTVDEVPFEDGTADDGAVTESMTVDDGMRDESSLAASAEDLVTP